jgi:hypothetical protein
MQKKRIQSGYREKRRKRQRNVGRRERTAKKNDKEQEMGMLKFEC